ncbi:MAG: carbon-nitrogen hydrolase family protein [Eubacteriales bacterium]|nr:carbon-nitrogen hydrolase family protein [Eubacteriales bacterium]MDD4389843.1 carbon-nitrogen hydrolase family protein [Eubacteriales bacterium]
MKISLVQMKMKENMTDNLEASIAYIKKAADESCDFILFPEVQLTQFFPQESGIDATQYLVTTDGAEIRAICDACKENCIAASPNVYLRDNNKNYDASFVIDSKGQVLGISKMVHIASFPSFYEAEYYAPSDDGFKVYDVMIDEQIYKIGVVVCFDRHFPESVRCCALQGAELIIIPSANLTNEPSDMFLWEMRVMAMQNSVYIAMCNRVGREGGIEFSGESVVVDYCGNVVSMANDKEQLLTAVIDLKEAARHRKNSPYFLSRRPSEYKAITEE